MYTPYQTDIGLPDHEQQPLVHKIYPNAPPHIYITLLYQPYPHRQNIFRLSQQKRLPRKVLPSN